LLWIEEFEESGRRITLMSSADFVNFVDKDKRIFSLALLESLDDSTW
jgi:hypothetical protein